MNPSNPTLRVLARDGRILIRDGLSICFYMRRSHREVEPAVTHSLETYLRVLGQSALGWYVDLEGDWQELDDKGWRQIREWMQWNTDISVHPLDDARVLVTLGERPEAGDTTQGQTLPLHRELARVLEPWLYHAPALRNPLVTEDTRRWERRFLD